MNTIITRSVNKSTQHLLQHPSPEYHSGRQRGSLSKAHFFGRQLHRCAVLVRFLLGGRRIGHGNPGSRTPRKPPYGRAVCPFDQQWLTPTDVESCLGTFLVRTRHLQRCPALGLVGARYAPVCNYFQTVELLCPSLVCPFSQSIV